MCCGGVEPSQGALAREARRRRRAAEIVAGLGLMERWASVGEPLLVGAVAFRLVVAPDIDLEINCARPSVAAGFAALVELAPQPGVWKLRFSNELDGPDRGLYWQLRYRPAAGETWKIDMWLLAGDHPGPRSQDLVAPMLAALAPETRSAILEIKESLLDGGVRSLARSRSYRAVLDGGVRSPAEFLAWRQGRPLEGLSFWRPGAAAAPARATPRSGRGDVR